MTSEWLTKSGPACPEGHLGRPLSRREKRAVRRLSRAQRVELGQPLDEIYWCETCQKGFHWKRLVKDGKIL